MRQAVHRNTCLAGEVAGEIGGYYEQAPCLAQLKVSSGGFVAFSHRFADDEDEASSGLFGLFADLFFCRGYERRDEDSAVSGRVEPLFAVFLLRFGGIRAVDNDLGKSVE